MALLKSKPIRLGFVPLVDCAPLVMAAELGLYRKHGLNIRLSRELGWATVREKIIWGELDTSHALAPMALAITLGLNCVPCDCVTALVLNLHGNAITLSRPLWERDVRTPQSIRDEIQRQRGRHRLTFGVVFLHSSHHLLLRRWLASAEILPERDVHLVVVPPAQMVTNLKAGNLDGYCAGEPWNSLAVQTGVGCCVAASAELSPGHPEKILLARRTFAEERSEEHLAMVAAILEACAFCADPANHKLIATTLAHHSFVGVPVESILPALTGRFDCGNGELRRFTDFTLFHDGDSNEPTTEKACWIVHEMRAAGLLQETVPPTFLARIFRSDLFHLARSQLKPIVQHENTSKAPVLAS